jgi:membrane-associated phospholipid phosphatase
MTAITKPRWLTPRVLTYTRWTALSVWAVVFGYDLALNGIPYWRSDLLLWLGLGLLAWSIGKRNILTVFIDFVPFAAVLVVYDYLRGISDTLGMPTWWYPQIDVDRFLFFGNEPTVWLQAHLRYPKVQWYDILVGLCYISFFFLPYVTAAALWLRSRTDFYRWTLRFVPLSFLAFIFFALIPAAPPWAAARCAPDEVVGHPTSPYCMSGSTRTDSGLLGQMTGNRGGTHPWIDQIATRGLGPLHLKFAQQVIEAGRVSADAVAAVPSLHAGGILLFSIFMWRRVNKWWRPLLVAYPLFMGFTLVYAGEHYVSDVLAGWLCAVLVHLAAVRIERWRKQRRSLVRLGGKISGSKTVENPCPPTSPPSLETTPSSISASAADSSTPPARSTAAPDRPGTTARSASN